MIRFREHLTLTFDLEIMLTSACCRQS